jgi:probable F420-dependent oxidoreductase
MTHPFRFGASFADLAPDTWREDVRRVESLGYSSLFWPDHFGEQLDPTAALAAVAGVTSRLHLGALVYDVDYRHPVVMAKAAATIQLLSGGRHEFGIGAGWMETDYREAGIPYDRPGVRIERLAEALEVIRSMWTQPKTSFEGVHYRITDIAQAAPLPAGSRPKILIGGGGPRILKLAGRYGDIVGINPTMLAGRITAETPADSAPERVREKVGLVRQGAEAAGRDPQAIELNSLSFVVAITDRPQGVREALSRSSGMSVEQVADCPLFLTGSAAEIRERLEKRREETGISYVVIQGRDREVLESFAEHVVVPLAGK